MIRLSSLGDVLLCAVALRALKARFPESAIHFLVASEFKEAAELLPAIDKIIVFDRKEGWRGLLRLRRLLSRRYEMIVDLQNSWRSAFLRVFCFPLMWAKATRYRLRRWVLIKFKRNLYRKVVPVPLRYVAAIEQFGAKDDGNGLDLQLSGTPDAVASENSIVLCPGAKHATKRWPTENWQKVAIELRKRGYHVVVCGTAAEETACREIAGGGEILIDVPLDRIAHKMRRATAVITHDSGLMHLACGSGAPVLALFGPTVQEFGFYPFRANSRVVENTLPCRPCHAFGSAICPKGHHDCLRLTTPERVIIELEQLISTPESSIPDAG